MPRECLALVCQELPDSERAVSSSTKKEEKMLSPERLALICFRPAEVELIAVWWVEGQVPGSPHIGPRWAAVFVAWPRGPGVAP